MADENTELRPCTMVKDTKAFVERMAVEKAKTPSENSIQYKSLSS